MYQFVEAASRRVIIAAYMPDREYKRMVGYLNRTGGPLEEGQAPFGGGHYSDADGNPIKPSPCEPAED